MKIIVWDKTNKREASHYFIDEDGGAWFDIDPYGVDMSGKRTIKKVQVGDRYEFRTTELPTEERIRELLDEWDVQPPAIEKHNFPLDSFIELRKSPHVFRRYLTGAILDLLKGEG